MRRFPLSVQHTLHQSRRLRSVIGCAGQRSLVLGAALLLGSTLTVAATANTTPTLTNLTLSKATVGEGEAFTINGTIVDPDPGEVHTLYIYPGRPTFEMVKVELPAGQLSFQVPYTYPDDRGENAPDGNIPTARDIKVWVSDDNPPNDNDEEAGETYQLLTIGVNNVAPSFAKGVEVKKFALQPGKVAIEGTVVDPGTDTLEVSADWGSSQQLPRLAPSPCSTTKNHFRCEHTYSATPRTYTVTLRVQDDDGGHTTQGVRVQIP